MAAAWAMLTSVMSPSVVVRVDWRSVCEVMASATRDCMSPPWAVVWVVEVTTDPSAPMALVRKVCCAAVRGPPKLPEALCWKWEGRTLPELYGLSVDDLLALVGGAAPVGTAARIRNFTPTPITCLRPVAADERLKQLSYP